MNLVRSAGISLCVATFWIGSSASGQQLRQEMYQQKTDAYFRLVKCLKIYDNAKFVRVDDSKELAYINSHNLIVIVHANEKRSSCVDGRIAGVMGLVKHSSRSATEWVKEGTDLVRYEKSGGRISRHVFYRAR